MSLCSGTPACPPTCPPEHPRASTSSGAVQSPDLRLCGHDVLGMVLRAGVVNAPGLVTAPSLERMGQCQESVEAGGSRTSCVSGRSGWCSTTRTSTRRSGRRSSLTSQRHVAAGGLQPGGVRLALISERVVLARYDDCRRQPAQVGDAHRAHVRVHPPSAVGHPLGGEPPDVVAPQGEPVALVVHRSRPTWRGPLA
jgi:hypothetical protein